MFAGFFNEIVEENPFFHPSSEWSRVLKNMLPEERYLVWMKLKSSCEMLQFLNWPRLYQSRRRLSGFCNFFPFILSPPPAHVAHTNSWQLGHNIRLNQNEREKLKWKTHFGFTFKPSKRYRRHESEACWENGTLEKCCDTFWVCFFMGFSLE